MWRVSALAIALLLLGASAGLADPITTGIAAFSGWFAKAGFFTKFAIQLGASLLLNSLANLLMPKPRAPDQKRELQIPRSRPPKRFVYGRTRMTGSPAPWRVKGEYLYGCLILNSRPSHGGTVNIFMDKRACTVAGGDIYDFTASGGAALSIEDFEQFTSDPLHPDNPRVWIGRGDQTGPPADMLSEAPEFFTADDAWEGCTVLWVRLIAGASEARSERWRAAPPSFEVEMDWSLLYDPRQTSHDADDPSTWAYSNNQALVLLDALRENPIRRYPMSQIHIESFIEAADVADEPVLRYFDTLDEASDVFEPRYAANGFIVWSGGELLEQVEAVAEAGAGDLVRIGGRVGYAAGEYREPLYTVSDIVEEGGIDYQVLRPGRELPSFVKGVYISPLRDWQEADLTPIEVPGSGDTTAGDAAVLELRMPFVTSATQAMRIQQIAARKLAAQKTLSVMLWPDAMNVVGGATVTTALPAPFTRFNGAWTVTAAEPALWVNSLDENGGTGVAMRIPVSLRENSASIYAWTPALDEQEILETVYDPSRAPFPAPTALSVTSGDGVSTVQESLFRVSFTGVAGADFYEIFLEPDGQPAVLVASTSATTGILVSAISGKTYTVSVRAVQEPVNSARRFSALVSVAGITALPADYDLDAPLDGVATGGALEIDVVFTAPNSANYRGMEFWGSDTDDVGAATLLATLYGAAGEAKTYTETGLSAAQTRFYFARSTGDFGFTSAYSASVSATTDA